MRLRRGYQARLNLQLAVVVATTAALGTARAQVDVEAQALFNTSIGWTDNVLQVPEEPVGADDLPPEQDGILVLAPGAVLILLTPGSTHSLSYGFGLTLYAIHDEANAYTHTLAYGSEYPLSDTTVLGIGGGVVLGQLSNFNRTRNPQAQELQPQNPGDDLFLNVFANQSLSHDFTDLWSGNQATTVTFFSPFADNQANTISIAETLGAQRQFEFDVVGPTLGTTYTRFGEITDDAGNETQPAQHQLTTTLAGTWQHQFNLSWATNLQAGIVHSMDVQNVSGHIVQPYGLASVNYVADVASAALTYQHTVGPNVFFNNTVLSDAVNLSVGVPLGRLPLDLSVGSGFAANRVIDADGVIGPPQSIFLADAALTYVPPQYPSLNAGLRYQFVKQFEGEENDDPNVFTPQPFQQNSVFLTLGVIFPDTIEGGNQALQASPFRPQPAGVDMLRPRQPEGESQDEEEESGGDGGESDE